MHKLPGALLIFLAGLALGWYAHERWRPETEAPRASIQPTPQAAPASQTPPDLTSPPQDEISKLLDNQAFQTVLEQYDTLQRDGHYNDARQLRTRILTHAGQLIAKDDIQPATQLLQLYLATEYRDSEAHTLLAEAQYKQGDTLAAIDTLYEAKGHAYRATTMNRITSRIRSMVAEQVEQLNASNGHEHLLELFQRLTQLEPSHAPYFIGLASTQLSLKDYEGAHRSLQLVEHNPEVESQVGTLLAILRTSENKTPQAAPPESSDLAGVPLLRKGNSFLVEAILNRSQALRLLIDTGASLTIITPDVLHNGSVQYRDTGRHGIFNTANGRISAPIYIIDSLAVGDWQVLNLEVGVLELDGSSGVNGLLGMNFLKHFQFFIDQDENILRLSVNASTGTN